MAPPIYLDHAATTPVRAEVLEAMTPFFCERFGNPSSVHRWGRVARTALDEARSRIAACLRAQPDEIVFTSGGTEGDNLAIIGPWRMRRAHGRNAVVTSPTEHKAVLEVVHQVARDGGEERLFPITADGLIDAASIPTLIDEQVAVVSVMWINNEIGVVQDVPAIGAQARSVGALMHTDAVQAFGKLPIDLTSLPVDLLSLSGHKIGAPKGIGAMFIRRGTPFEPLFHGGSQDRGRRPGTENVAFAVALAVAAELQLAEREAECARLGAMRDALQTAILARVPDAVVHGIGAPRAPHILNVSVPGTDSESLLMALDLAGIAASGGSACQSGSVSPSHVLSAMGVSRGLAGAAVRLSVGTLSTDEDIARVCEVFPALVEKARRLAGAA
ncbi:MAG: cysteine desulfurase family protein [Gemmatimonadaceae bacterium]|nr:cysteine desulfurase family protein [Gemmatimonadaceae bacterium]